MPSPLIKGSEKPSKKISKIDMENEKPSSKSLSNKKRSSSEFTEDKPSSNSVKEKHSTRKSSKTSENDLPKIHNSKDPQVSSDDQFDQGKPLSDFPIHEYTVTALSDKGINTLFPIQWKCFDLVFQGQDVIGKARTGSGKTLSFVLPVLERLRLYLYGIVNSPSGMLDIDTIKANGKNASTYRVHHAIPHKPRVLIMAPTRELANQVCEVVQLVGEPSGISSVCIYGGAPYSSQANPLRQGVDIVVGTPGRINDHITRNNLSLEEIDFVVLDEADKMLDMNFQEAIEIILQQIPPDRKHQTLLYSATLPKFINTITDKYLSSNHTVVDVVGSLTNKTSVTVRHIAIKKPDCFDVDMVSDIILLYAAEGSVIIFCDTKSQANELVLSSKLAKDCQVLHGDILQAQREVTLKAFRDKQFRILVATDLAARGLDIEHVDMVIQMGPPLNADTYIHRSGRTGRAGRHGISCILYTPKMQRRLEVIQSFAGISFEMFDLPKPSDIYGISAKNAIKRITQLEESYPDHVTRFLPYAEEFLKQTGDAHRALSACLSIACGFSEPLPDISLLGNKKGMKTMEMRLLGQPINRNITVVFQQLAEILKPELVQSTATNDAFNARASRELGITELAFTFDDAAILDVSIEQAKKLLDNSNDCILFAVVSTLPRLTKVNFQGRDNQRSSWQNDANMRRNNAYGGGASSRGRGGDNNQYQRGNSRGGFNQGQFQNNRYGSSNSNSRGRSRAY